MSGRPVSLALYALAASALAPAAPTWLRRRISLGKEDPARWSERLGRSDAERPPGRLAWLHGVSVGESLSLLPLAERLRDERPGVTLLVTSGTRAAAEVLERRLPDGAIHQYAPLDTPGAARRFLDHWRPELGVFVESELWPNLILAARARGMRLALVSARLSARSLAGWTRAPAAARAVLGAFELILARDDAAGEGLERLGAKVAGVADLKFGAPPPPADPVALAAARAAYRGHPVLLAASTHPGEEAVVLAAFDAVRGEGEPRLIIAPRHPVRGEEIERLARERGLAVGRRSAGAQPGADLIYVADTVGELGLWYRLASLALVGGSLVDGIGGHNPLEPARLGRPFVSGPYVAAWPVYGALDAAGATRLIDPAELAAWFARAIGDPAGLSDMAARAWSFASEGDAAAGSGAARVLELLAP